MFPRTVLLVTAILAFAPLLNTAEGSLETQQFNTLKGRSAETARKAREKEEELFRLCPEAKSHFNRPSRRQILDRIRREKLRAYPPGVAQVIPDTVRVLTIKVEFEEDDTPLTTGNGKMNLAGNGEPMYNEDGSHNLYYDPPHDSRYFHRLMEALRNYYLATSDGKLYVDFDIYPQSDTLSYQVPHQMCYYGDPENWFIGFFTLIRDAIQAADEDTSLHFKQGGDEVYDAYIIFHAGSMYQTDYALDSPCDLAAAFGIGASDLGLSMRTDDGCWIDEAIVYGETAFQDGVPGGLQGGLAHEFGHQLGLIDLYDPWETMGMGSWALMGTGNWNLNGLVPPHLCAFSSEALGFIEPAVLTGDSSSVQVRYRGSRDASGTKIVKIPIHPDEYFLVENRIAWASPDSVGPDPDSSGRRVWKDGVLVAVNDYDLGLPPEIRQGGLAVFHVDSLKIRLDTLGLPNYGFPKGVDMEEADGVQDFETYYWELVDWDAAFYGTPYDVFFEGSFTDSFTPTSAPNTNDNLGSNTHIHLTNISAPDTVMSFDLRFAWVQAGFPVAIGHAFDVNSPNVADLDGDGSLEVLIASTDWRVYAFRSDGSSYTGHPEGWFNARRTGSKIYSSVAVGDMDGDDSNGLEVACGCDDGQVYGWHSYPWDPDTLAFPIAGFPVATEAEVTSAPLFADIDSDGKDELLVGSNDQKLYAWEIEAGSAQIVEGFPVFLGQWVWATPVALNSAIYALSGDGRLFKLSNEGKPLWTALEESVGPWLPHGSSSPVVTDMDRDGAEEIVVTVGSGEIYAVSDRGQVEWKAIMRDTSWYSSPALGDLDGNGYLDVVQAAGQKIYAFNQNGASREGFPIDTKSGTEELPILSSPVLGDIDGDGQLEIVIGSEDGKVLAYENDGKAVQGFPLSCGGSVFSTPALVDLDGDGDVEICAGSDDGRLHCWDLPGEYDPEKTPWPMHHRDAAHLGYYPSSLLPPLPPPGGLLPLSRFYIYPNPVSESPAVIRYELGTDADRVDIKVFNVAGDLIAELEGKTGRGDQDNLFSLEGIASGLYICRIQAESGEEKVVHFKKFAVVK